jgi:hypothetical protein
VGIPDRIFKGRYSREDLRSQVQKRILTGTDETIFKIFIRGSSQTLKRGSSEVLKRGSSEVLKRGS